MSAFVTAIERASATVVQTSSHAFPGTPTSRVILILRESHAVLHSWPETGTVKHGHLFLLAQAEEPRGCRRVEQVPWRTPRLRSGADSSCRRPPRRSAHAGAYHFALRGGCLESRAIWPDPPWLVRGARDHAGERAACRHKGRRGRLRTTGGADRRDPRVQRRRRASRSAWALYSPTP